MMAPSIGFSQLLTLLPPLTSLISCHSYVYSVTSANSCASEPPPIPQRRSDYLEDEEPLYDTPQPVTQNRGRYKTHSWPNIQVGTAPTVDSITFTYKQQWRLLLFCFAFLVPSSSVMLPSYAAWVVLISSASLSKEIVEKPGGTVTLPTHADVYSAGQWNAVFSWSSPALEAQSKKYMWCCRNAVFKCCEAPRSTGQQEGKPTTGWSSVV